MFWDSWETGHLFVNPRNDDGVFYTNIELNGNYIGYIDSSWLTTTLDFSNNLILLPYIPNINFYLK